MKNPSYVVTATPPADLADLWGLTPRRYPPESTETVCALVEALRACGYEVEVETTDGRIVSSGSGADVISGRTPRLTPEMLLAASSG
jgi:hypothetical protein